MQSGSNNKITRKLLVALMEWLSKTTVSRPDGRVLSVPIQYCSHQKFLQIMKSASARKNMDLEANTSPVEQQWILPRISVNLTGIVFDTTRHINKTNQIQSGTGEMVYAPVPYNLEIEVSAVSKTMDDAFQIMETIIPYFGPGMSLDVKLYQTNSESITLTLNNLSFDFPSEVDEFSERLFTISYYFTIRANYYRQPRTLSRISNPLLLPMYNTDSSGNPIDKEGNLIDFGYNQNNNPVNKNGLPIVYGLDANGNLIDKYGNFILNGMDASDFLIDIYGNKILDSNSNPIRGTRIEERMYYNGVEIFKLTDNLGRNVVGGIDMYGNPVDSRNRRIIGGVKFHIDYDDTLFEQYVLTASNPYPKLKQGQQITNKTTVTLKKTGEWSSTRTYDMYDLALYDINWYVWINSESGSGIEPGTTGNWQNYWTPLTVISKYAEISNGQLTSQLEGIGVDEIQIDLVIAP